jgi:hypothetical protein
MATSAQYSYRRLLRDFVGPALRTHGLKGSSGSYKRTSGEYLVSIGFAKHPRSSKDHVYYHLVSGVTHPDTKGLYDHANREARDQGREWETAPAGTWHGDFPGHFLPGFPWVELRAEADVSSHAEELLNRLNQYLFPEIERQLRLPLSIPTPPSERPVSKSKEQRDQEHRSRLLQALPSVHSQMGNPPKPQT